MSKAKEAKDVPTIPRKNTAQAAAFLGISEVTLKNTRSTGKLGNCEMPPYYRIGKRVWYYDDDLEEYVRNCRVVPATESVSVAA